MRLFIHFDNGNLIELPVVDVEGLTAAMVSQGTNKAIMVGNTIIRLDRVLYVELFDDEAKVRVKAKSL